MAFGAPRGRNFFIVLAELLIVLAVVAAIGIQVVPAAIGSVSFGKRPTYASDEQQIRRAVDAYMHNPTDLTRKYPTFSGNKATSVVAPAPTPRSGPYIDFRLISGPEPWLSEPPRSAGPLNATGIYTGTYNWYIDLSGKVASNPEEGDVYP